MTEDKKEISLRVGELTERNDFGRGIVRLSAKDMKMLSVNEGDVIEIEGKRKTAAIAVRAYPADIGLDIIRMDGLERRNCGAGIGDVIKVRKSAVKEAKAVTIAPARKGIIIHMAGDLIKQNLLMRPVMTGDIIIPNPVVQDRRNQNSLFEQFFGMDFGDFFFTPFGEEKFVIVNTEPKGVVRVTRATEVELLPQATKPIEESRIPEVTYEDLGGLHEEVKKVREMIELPLKHPELFERLGIEPPKGILLHGPPGTGKTLLAKAVANESGARFLVINGPEIMCVDGDTKIFTNPKGHVKARDIFGLNGHVKEKSGNLEVVELENPISSFGIQEDGTLGKVNITHVAKLSAESFNVKLSNGNEVIASHNQPFLVYENGNLVWKRVSELKKGMFIARINKIGLPEESYAIPLDELEGLVENNGLYSLKSRNIGRSNYIKLPKVTSENLLEFLGFIVSEGSIDKEKGSVIFSNNDAKLRKKYKTLLNNLFGIRKAKEYADGRIIVYSKLLIEFMELLGFSRESKLAVPGYFYKLPGKEVSAFVRGYFDGDGTVSMSQEGKYPTPKLYSKSKEFLLDMQVLMQLKLGISTKTGKHNTPKGMVQELVVRGYGGRLKFLENVGSNTVKLDKLMKIRNVKRSKEFNNVPFPKALVDAVRTLEYKRYRNNDWYVYGKGDFTKHAMEKLYSILKESGKAGGAVENEFKLLMRDDIAWEKIEDIESVGRKDLYDFTVDKGNFAAGLLLLHNSKFYGESEENLRKVFDQAEKDAPSIIFIDEIDAIAPKREEVRGDVEKRVVSQLLTMMDGLKGRGKVIVIGATNIPNALDPALRRPGRFDREIELGVPNKDGRKEILQIHTRGMPLAKNVVIEKIAEITYGYVGADISALCKEAAMHALRRALPDIGLTKEEKPVDEEVLKKLIVTKEDFDYALKMVEPSAMREVLIEIPHVKWNEIGGLEDVKSKLKEAVEWPLKYPDSFKRLGIRPPTGILLYGPPGCGKTLLAKAVANESGANFISIKGPELLSMWVGETEKHIRDVFRRAKQVAPSIIFFDEVDSLVPKRGYEAGSHVSERVVSQLLAEISGLEDMHDVVVIAATNRPDILDPALLRPGRFDRQILVPTPDAGARYEVLRVHTANSPLSKDVDLKKLTKDTEGFSGADMEALVREAGTIAMRRDINSKEITKDDFEKALRTTKPSVTEEMNQFYEQMVKKKRSQKMEEAALNYTG